MLIWVFLAALILVVALLHGYVEQFRRGPSHCMGCGKCDETGVCILTNRPVGRGREKV